MQATQQESCRGGGGTRSLAQDTALVVRGLEKGEEAAWDHFVLSHAHGSPFHLTAWSKSIEQTFGYEPAHLAVWDDGRLRAVLPLFLVENILLRKALISTPFAVYGGALADSTEALDALRAQVTARARSLGVQYVELRNAYPEQCMGFEAVERYVTFTQEIGADETAVLERIPRKTRRMVRKSLERNFATRVKKGDFSCFEDLYAKSLRRLGTPAFPRKHFQHLIENFGEMLDIREITLDGSVVAAVMSFYYRDQVLPYYGASDPAYNAHSPNNFMYFDLMRWSAANGYRLFDFGRSKKSGSGSYDFKSHWGMVERNLPYEMLLVKRRGLPNYNPNNSLYRIPITIWQHLPLAVTRVLGPIFIRLVP